MGVVTKLPVIRVENWGDQSMAARITLERVLRDNDDAAGQSIRNWKIESDPGHITIRMTHGDGFVMLRLGDIGTFVADLYRAKDAAVSLSRDENCIRDD